MSTDAGTPSRISSYLHPNFVHPRFSKSDQMLEIPTQEGVGGGTHLSRHAQSEEHKVVQNFCWTFWEQPVSEREGFCTT